MTSAVPPLNSPVKKPRSILIDGLRGLAAVAVMLHHYYNETAESIRIAVASVIPRPLEWAMERGAAGVDTFFLISGFVIVMSFGGARVTRGSASNFAINRFFRIWPPYLLAIVLSLTIALVADRMMHRATVLPTWDILAANVLLIQAMVGAPSLVFVAWTLSHEVQFYLLFIGLLAAAQRVGRRVEVPTWAWLLAFGATGLGSILWTTEVPRFRQATCVNTWHLFASGAFLYLFHARKIDRRAALGFLALECGLLAWHPTVFNLTAVGTIALILVASPLGGIEGWLDFWLFRFLGRISYPLYLVHWPIGNRVLNLLAKYQGGSTSFGVAVFLGAIGMSVAAAVALHYLVEAPAMKFGRRFRLATPDRPVRPEGPAPDPILAVSGEPSVATGTLPGSKGG